jgi:putative transposase
LLEKYITQHDETLKQQPASAVYALLAREAQQQHIPVPSYRTFCQRIKERPHHEQTLKRLGPRAAAHVEPFYWELEQTTPRQGDRPWEMVHLDHTELDSEKVERSDRSPAGQTLGQTPLWISH